MGKCGENICGHLYDKDKTKILLRLFANIRAKMYANLLTVRRTLGDKLKLSYSFKGHATAEMEEEASMLSDNRTC